MLNGFVTKYTGHGKNEVDMAGGSGELDFMYEAQNKPGVVVFNGTAYAYLYNQQDDVIGLLDSNGTHMVSYTYDAWGKPISKTGTLASTLGTINPFRYRGYVYDEEAGFYYASSRYYDPEIGRFISPDTTDVLTATPMGLTDKNLYPRGVRSGIRQLQKYNKNLGGGFNLRLELY